MKAGRTLMDLGFWCLPPAISHQVRRDLPSRLCPRIVQRDVHSIEVAPGDLSRWCVFCEEVVVPLCRKPSKRCDQDGF